jgi:hypothetical protein
VLCSILVARLSCVDGLCNPVLGTGHDAFYLHFRAATRAASLASRWRVVGESLAIRPALAVFSLRMTRGGLFSRRADGCALLLAETWPSHWLSRTPRRLSHQSGCHLACWIAGRPKETPKASQPQRQSRVNSRMPSCHRCRL